MSPVPSWQLPFLERLAEGASELLKMMWPIEIPAHVTCAALQLPCVKLVSGYWLPYAFPPPQGSRVAPGPVTGPSGGAPFYSVSGRGGFLAANYYSLLANAFKNFIEQAAIEQRQDPIILVCKQMFLPTASPLPID